MVAERAISFIKNNPERARLWGQDALNAILVDQWIELSPCWNRQGWSKTRRAHEDKHGLAIVHFSNDSKPWQWANRHAFKHEYRHYRLKTPWREYRAENIPPLPERLLRHCARLILPSTIRGWLRARLGRRLA